MHKVNSVFTDWYSANSLNIRIDPYLLPRQQKVGACHEDYVAGFRKDMMEISLLGQVSFIRLWVVMCQIYSNHHLTSAALVTQQTRYQYVA